MAERPTLVVIDDEPQIREIIMRAAIEVGYCVIGAKNSEAGLSICEKKKPTVITLDVLMPELDGIEVINKLAAMQLATLPHLIIVSGSFNYLPMAEELAKAARAATNRPDWQIRALPKPFKREELKNILSELKSVGLKQT